MFYVQLAFSSEGGQVYVFVWYLLGRIYEYKMRINLFNNSAINVMLASREKSP